MSALQNWNDRAAHAGYEGVNGWQDGRLGRAYDLIAAVVEGRGETIFKSPLLAQIEALDAEGAQQ